MPPASVPEASHDFPNRLTAGDVSCSEGTTRSSVGVERIR